MYMPNVEIKKPSPETDLVKMTYNTGRFLNNKLTGSLLKLASESDVKVMTSFLRSDSADIAIQYYWEQYWLEVFLIT